MIITKFFRFKKINFDEADYPASYKMNNLQEELIVGYIDNFGKQYHNLYTKRKPLFIKPLNEFNVPVRKKHWAILGRQKSLNFF